MGIKPNIVILDNNLIFRQCLVSIITTENIGHVIGEFSDENEFIELLSDQCPDIVLIDIDMPDMIGINITQKILKLFPELKVIACSNFIEEEYYYHLNELGFKGFFLKSGSIYQLEKVIRVALL
jgi:two-component system, NarL family, response regulator DegU